MECAGTEQRVDDEMPDKMTRDVGTGTTPQSYEEIATISSPSTTTQILLEILESASRKNLIGEVVWFEFEQDEKIHRALGQITEIKLENYMLEFSEMRSLARQRGQVNPISGIQDTHRGVMAMGAVFGFDNDRYVPSVIGTVPPTGTYVRKANDEILGELLAHDANRLSYLGRFYESNTKLPLWFPHFGPREEGGAGESYNIGIYGKTGSGKSTLAKMILARYAQHPQMSIFVLDPSGEFTKAVEGQRVSEVFKLDLHKVCRDAGKDVKVYNVQDLALGRWDIFTDLLIRSRVLNILGIKHKQNRTFAAEMIEAELRRANTVLTKLNTQETFNHVLGILREERNQRYVYSTPGGREQLARAVDNPPNDLYENHWKPIADLFSTEDKTRLEELIKEVYDDGENRPIVMVNLARKDFVEGILWNDELKALIIKNIVSVLMRMGEREYKENGLLNTLVILDEAQKLVPNEKFDEDRRDELRDKLVNAVQTTRKYGLGWMFLSLSLSALHKEIYHGNRISFYGFGLSAGSELRSLKELIPRSEAISFYQSFRDPHSVADVSLRSYSFMAVGPVSPLSISGSPMFLTTFTSPDEFLSANGSTGAA